MSPELILSSLVYNEQFYRKVFPHLKAEYFTGADKIIFSIIQKYHNSYDKIPTSVAIEVELSSKQSIGQLEYEEAKKILDEMTSDPQDLEWLVNTTERYCRDRALYNATAEAIKIQTNAALPLDEQDRKVPALGTIEDIFRDALGVHFNKDVGHDYLLDFESRFIDYTTNAKKVPHRIGILNKITDGGVEMGTLNLLMAGPNVGKSLGLCHLTSDYMLDGKDVLYISAEMSESAVSKRVDANLLNIPMDELKNMTKEQFSGMISNLKTQKAIGRLVVKQFPTGGGNVHHFNSLMNELWTKKGWKPDIVMVDYLGICASTRMNFSENSYTLVKAVAEEVRGFAIQHNVPVWSGAQTNRGGWDSTDVSMADIAESAGLAQTADLILALMEDENLIQMKQILVKQIKNRYGDKSYYNKFNLGIDKAKQRWYELDAEATVTPAPSMTQTVANAASLASLPTQSMGSLSGSKGKLDAFADAIGDITF